MRAVLSESAVEDLRSLHAYIAEDNASFQIAERYIDRILASFDKLETFPEIGRKRDDLKPGFRTYGFERKVLVVYSIREDVVRIEQTFYGGRDVEAFFRGD
jgi:toxin ParE1/3/4